MSINDMLQWWNLIYLAPFMISLVWIVATVFMGAHDGGMGHGAHGVGHDVSSGIGHAAHGLEHGIENALHSAGHAIEHSLHMENGHAADDGSHAHAHDSSHSHDGHGDDSIMARVLLILGIGRVPITLLIGVFLLCWGSFGMLANRFFEPVMKFPAVYIWPSMGATFVASFIITRSMAAIVGRLMPGTETYAVSRFDLIGSLGKTIFPTAESTGTVDIKDIYGTLHRVQAKTADSSESIPAGKEVIVVDFDDEDKRFVVKLSDL